MYEMNALGVPLSSSQLTLVAFQPRSAELAGRHVWLVAVELETIVIVSLPSETANVALAPNATVAAAENWLGDVIPPAASRTVYVPGGSRRASTVTGSGPEGRVTVPEVFTIAPLETGLVTSSDDPSRNTRLLEALKSPSTVNSPPNV